MAPKSGLKLLALILALAAFPRSSAAAIITPIDVRMASVASCMWPVGDEDVKGSNCTSTSYLLEDAANASTQFIKGRFNGTPPTDQNFFDAFNLWNETQGGAWTINDGGLLDLRLDIVIVPNAAATFGGVRPILAMVENYKPGKAGPALTELAWIQAIYVNYQPIFTTGIEPPLLTLDDYNYSNGGSREWRGRGPFSLDCKPVPATFGIDNPLTFDRTGARVPRPFCAPIYPFQFSDERFEDVAQSLWPASSLRGIALLSTVDQVKHVVNVYQGVDWGYDLSVTVAVPEPSSAVLLTVALAVLFCARRRGDRIRSNSTHLDSHQRFFARGRAVS